MRKNPWKEIEATLGYRFRKKQLLEMALTHPSFVHETKDAPTPCNQRLEFLGDAILDLITAEHLYHKMPDADEGDLTRLRSNICNGKSLAEMGAIWNLGAYLRLGKGEINSGGEQRKSNLTDAVEAILGAVYLDGGLKSVQKIFHKHFEPVLQRLVQDAHEENPKGHLQEWAQCTYKESPVYVISGEEGPSHARHYKATVSVMGKVLAVGSGSSKRRAEVDAARIALMQLPGKST